MNTDYLPKLTADRIKLLVNQRGVSMAALNEACGLSKNAISSSSKGIDGMKASNLVAIADYLHTSADYLLGRSDNPDDFSNELQEIKHILESLSVRGRAELMTIIFDFSDREG